MLYLDQVKMAFEDKPEIYNKFLDIMKNFKAHILIVDDDDRIRDLVKEYLNQNNYLVSTAKDSNDAFEKTKVIKFDLIVLDLSLIHI